MHGPKPRSHAFKLNKKVRRLGLKIALTARAAEGKASISSPPLKTKKGKKRFFVSALHWLELWDYQNIVILFGPSIRDGLFSLIVFSVFAKFSCVLLCLWPVIVMIPWVVLQRLMCKIWSFTILLSFSMSELGWGWNACKNCWICLWLRVRAMAYGMCFDHSVAHR